MFLIVLPTVTTVMTIPGQITVRHGYPLELFVVMSNVLAEGDEATLMSLSRKLSGLFV